MEQLCKNLGIIMDYKFDVRCETEKKKNQQGNSITKGSRENSISLARERKEDSSVTGEQAGQVGLLSSEHLLKTRTQVRPDLPGCVGQPQPTELVVMCKAFPDVKITCCCKEIFLGGGGEEVGTTTWCTNV